MTRIQIVVYALIIATATMLTTKSAQAINLLDMRGAYGLIPIHFYMVVNNPGATDFRFVDIAAPIGKRKESSILLEKGALKDSSVNYTCLTYAQSISSHFQLSFTNTRYYVKDFGSITTNDLWLEARDKELSVNALLPMEGDRDPTFEVRMDKRLKGGVIQIFVKSLVNQNRDPGYGVSYVNDRRGLNKASYLDFAYQSQSRTYGFRASQEFLTKVGLIVPEIRTELLRKKLRVGFSLSLMY